jgi:iron-sulfur cluster repair protein YtfE (RIC family)
MEIKYNNYQVKASSWKKSRSWGHKATLIKDGSIINTVSIRYHNRTWESYEFESVLFKVVEDYKEREINDFSNRIKKATQRKRLSKKRKDDLIYIFNKKQLGQDLNELKKLIKNYKPGADPVFSAMKMFTLLGDLSTPKEDVKSRVEYKQRIVFATMKNKIPNWEEPRDWQEISDQEKLNRLEKIENLKF